MHGSLKTLTVLYLHAKLHFPNLNGKVILDMADFHSFRVIVTGTDFLFETLFSLAVKKLFAEKTEHFKIFVYCFYFLYCIFPLGETLTLYVQIPWYVWRSLL